MPYIYWNICICAYRRVYLCGYHIRVQIRWPGMVDIFISNLPGIFRGLLRKYLNLYS